MPRKGDSAGLGELLVSFFASAGMMGGPDSVSMARLLVPRANDKHPDNKTDPNTTAAMALMSDMPRDCTGHPARCMAHSEQPVDSAVMSPVQPKRRYRHRPTQMRTRQ